MASRAIPAHKRPALVATWAQAHGEEFRGKNAAEFLNVKDHAIGPTLRKMVNAGTLTKRKSTYGTTYYKATIMTKNTQSDSIVPALKSSMEEEIVRLEEKLRQLDIERQQALDAIARLRNAVSGLSSNK